MTPPAKSGAAATTSSEVAALRVEEWPAAKRAVYDAALTLFFERGFDATAVQDIVGEAQLTKGAFYHYFKSKEELLRVINERFLHMLLPAFTEIRDRNLPVEDSLRQVIEVLFHTVAECREEIVIFFEEWRHLSKDAFAPTKAKREQVETVLTDIIEAGMSSGQFRTVGPPRLIAFAIFGMCAYAQYWWEPGGEYPPEGLASVFSDLVIRGLEPVPAARRPSGRRSETRARS